MFAAKTWLLQLQRGCVNWREGLGTLPRIDGQGFDHLAAETRTPLWNDSIEADPSLQAGKVHNLRIAARQLNGVMLPAGALFSFWRQLGPATRIRGYVRGRMLREGCMIPAVGGGLCQLSNALYELALQADFEIVERWAHSRIVPGSAAALGRDATVAWNYIDLRFRASHELRLSVELSGTELIVGLRSRTPWLAPKRKPKLPVPVKVPVALPNSCDSCDATDCFRHTGPSPRTQQAQAFLVAENWPEFRSYVQAQRTDRDLLALPLDGQRWRAPRYAWPTGGFTQLQTASPATLMHGLATRRAAPTAPAQLQLQLRASRTWARQFARALRPEMTEITVAQSLLPWLWMEGHLGGRRLRVLMTRLPLHALHARLDAASARHSDRKTLGEFRAPDFLVKAEQAALAQAETIVTPHRDIAALFGGRAHLLDWHLPTLAPLAHKPRTGRIAFVGPTVARKGAFALREAARELGLIVIPLGRHLEAADFWQGIATETAGDNWLQRVDAVVQPALVEEQPRPLLQALAAGVPVIASAACGLGSHPGLTLVPPDDAEALVAALR